MMPLGRMFFVSLTAVSLTFAGCALGLGRSERVLVSKSEPQTHVEKQYPEMFLEGVKVSRDAATGRVTVEGTVACAYRRYEYQTWEETSYTVEHNPLGSNRSQPEITRMRSNRVLTDIRFVPAVVRLQVGGISGNIQPDRHGYFRAVFQFRPEMKKPLVRRFSKLAHRYSAQTYVVVSIPTSEEERLGMSFATKGRTPIPRQKIYFLVPDLEAIKAHLKAIKAFVDREINSKMFWLVISTRDSDSRARIPADLSVECLNAPGIDAILVEKFDRDEDLAYARKQVGRFLGAGERMAGSGGVIRILSLEGARYKVSSVHSKYYHFQASFKAEKAHSKKILLLVEKGSKVRAADPKEEKGRVVDE